MRLPPVTRVVLVLAALLSAPAAASAQDVSLASLKAAFLANFAKFAEWPDDALPAGRVFTFCVVGDKAVAAALEQGIKDRPGQEPMSVVVMTPDAALRGCQVLYLGGMNLKEARRAGEPLKGAPVFTVSDVDGFTEQGGVAQLRLERGRMRFAINPAAAQRAHLALSAKLLSLAIIVKDSQ
jgi:hypothetical protein